jgi:hypothetical protein
LSLIQEVLKKIIIISSNNNLVIKKEFKRILVQDSTIIKLPLRLFKEFSGVSNGKVQVANARIQVVYDLISEQFLKFEIGPYSKNDQKAAPEIELQKGDLVLRDRGYLITSEIIRHIRIEAHFIFRHKFDMVYLDKETHEAIDLYKILKSKQNIDMEVRLRTNPETIVRIVTVRVTEEIANMRRRKAKKELKNVSGLYLKMLDWSIFITSIEPDKADFKVLFDLYGLRWKIETIFKNWKSNLKFDKIHNVSSTQLKILLHSRFLVIILIHHIHSVAKRIVRVHFGKYLSFLKLTSFLSDHLHKINSILKSFKSNNSIITDEIKTFAYYCSYDKRNDRNNFEEEMIRIFNM